MSRALDWIGWIALMHGPFRIVAHADNPVGRWCLRRAGAWAYKDHCR